MNRFSFLLLLLFLSGVLSRSYSQTSDITKGCLPLTVNFKGPDGKANYFWDFKDGVTSNLKNPSNIFNKEGAYNVTLHETPDGPVISTIQIQVYPSPVLSATVTSGCAPVDVSFQSASVLNPAIKVNTYIWVFGDGQSATSTENEINHHYASPGTYNLSLGIITNFPSCNKTEILPQAVNLLTPPVAAFTTNPTNTVTCKDSLTVGFTNASTFSQEMAYSWNFGNGNSSNSLNPSPQKYFAGNYTASLTVRANPALPGCATTVSKNIAVGRPPVVIEAEDDTICIYERAIVSLRNPPPGTYLWDIGPDAIAADRDSNGIQDLEEDTVIISFNKPGLHPVSISVITPDGQCTDIRTVNIFVDEVTAAITPTDTFACEAPFTVPFEAISNQSDVSYLWYIDRGNPDYKGQLYLYNIGDSIVTKDTIENQKQFDYTFHSAYDSIYYSKNENELFWIRLNVTSDVTGCRARDTTFVHLNLPNAQFTVDRSSGCAPLTVKMKDLSAIDMFSWNNSIVSWEWIFGDGQSQVMNVGSEVQHVYTTPGVYEAKLVVTTDMGCKDTSYAVEIKVGSSLPSIDFSSNKLSVCVGELFELSAENTSPLINGYHFVTNNNKVFHCAEDSTVSYSYKDVLGPQTVSLIYDYNGCLTTITKPNYITVNGAIAKIDYKALCSSPLEYNFSSKSLGASTLNWSFGDGDFSSLSDFTHAYSSAGDYEVRLVASGGGCPASIDTRLIKARNVKAKISMDTLLCVDVPYKFDAASSIDVCAGCVGSEVWECVNGYRWDFANLDGLQVQVKDSGYVGPLYVKIDTFLVFPDSPPRPFTTRHSVTTFKFNDPGVHTVNLIVEDINGCPDTATATFKVFDIALATPSISKLDICVPSDVLFKDNSTSDTTIVSWQWSFGDGILNTLNNNSQFNHTYVTPAFDKATYPVSLTLTDALGCTETIRDTIKYYKPESYIRAADTLLCLGDSITLFADDYTIKGSNLSFAWDLANGQFSSVQTNSPIAYPVGDHMVKLVYTEVATGCKDSTSMTVSVQSYPVTKIVGEINSSDPTIETKVDPSKPICAPKEINFSSPDSSDFPVTSQFWDFGNGNTGVPDGQTYTYDKGIYNVILRESTSYGCESRDTMKLHLVRPEGNFTVSKNQICRYDEITFTMRDTVDVDTWIWSYGDGIVESNVDKVSHQYDFHPPNGFTFARLVLYKGECPNNPALERAITIFEIIADFDRQDTTDQDTVVCFTNPLQPFTFINNSKGIKNYTWYFGDNTTSNDYNPVHVYSAPGTYTVTLAADNNVCQDTIRKNVIINPGPSVIAIGDTVCEGDLLYPYVYNVDPTSTYLWTPSTGLSDPASPTPVVNISHPIVYALKETNQYGCVDSTNVMAFVIEDDHLGDWDTTIIIGDQIHLPAFGTPIYNFNWSPDEGLSCLDCDFPEVQPLKDITYDLTVTDTMSCFTSEYTFFVKVIPETFIKMPTAFTPNEDSSNDLLYVRGWGIKELISFQVFNRWGQLLYISSNIDDGWDGKYKGVLQSQDSYVYKILATDYHNKELYLEGYVNLLH